MKTVQVATDIPQCCDQTSQYLVQYKSFCFEDEKTIAVCSKCLQEEQCFQADIESASCVHCSHDITENLLTMITINEKMSAASKEAAAAAAEDDTQ